VVAFEAHSADIQAEGRPPISSFATMRWLAAWAAQTATIICLACMRCQAFAPPASTSSFTAASVYTAALSRRSTSSRAMVMSDAVVAPPPKVVTGTERLLWIENLSNTFDGVRHQFKGIDLTVCRSQKLGVVGVNGCGKSTLLKVIAGKEDADSGKINSPKNSRIVYVEQEPEFPEGATVSSVVYASDSPLMNTLREYQEACDAMTADPEGAGVGSRFEKAMAAMEADGKLI
jgi:ABC transporter